MYLATLRLPGTPDPHVIAAALDALAVANCRWILEEWAAGVEPPCCLRCAGVAWVPDRLGQAPTFAGAPEVIRRRRASCGSIAAYEAGRKIAEAVRSGATLASAREGYSVALVDEAGVVYGAREPLESAVTPQQRGRLTPPRRFVAGNPAGSQPSRATGKPRRAPYWHAVVRTPTGFEDPTKDMVRG